MSKKAIFTYGRMNPPTKGHESLIKTLLKNSKKEGADPFIVITHTQNKKKNPLTAAEKKNILEKMFPNVPVLSTSKSEPNPNYIINKLKSKGYDNIQMMVGSDRLNSFGFVKAPVRSGGERGPSSISATKVRAAALNNKNIKPLMSNKLSNKNLKNIKNKIVNRLRK